MIAYEPMRVCRGRLMFGDVGDCSDCRPVVVIDPEDRDQVERLASELARKGAHRGRVPHESEVSAVSEALRSLIAPPKPEEPTGLGAVVEDAAGDKWVRADREGKPWFNTRTGGWRYWTGIERPVEKAPGWSE